MSLISNPSFKYVTVLGMTYFRLTGKAKEVYPILEDLYSDYRKVRVRNSLGHFQVMHVDELAEQLLTEEILFDIVLPRLVKRETLEINDELEPRVSPLEEELNRELNLQIKPKGALPKIKEKESSESSSSSDSSESEEEPPTKKLDENSDEYWIALRKRAGLSD